MVLGSAEVDHSLSLSHRTSRNLDLLSIPLSGRCESSFFFGLSGIHYCIKVLCNTVVCTPYASLRGSEPIVGMDGSRCDMGDWFGFFALLSLPPSDLDVFVVCTTGSFDLTICVTLLCDFLGGNGTILLLLFSSFSSSRNRPFAEDTWRREFTCMHTLLFSSVGIVETLYLVRSLD